jgi:hypothetical protein
MKHLLLIATFLIATSSASAAVDPKVHKLCAKATDYIGCVKLNSGNSEKSNTERQQAATQKERLIAELRKLGTRLKNSSLISLSENARDFRDVLALSNAENVGIELLKNAKVIDHSIDILRRYWSNKIEDKYITADCKVTRETSQIFNTLFDGLAVDATCTKSCALFGCSDVGQDLTYKLADAIEKASNMIVERGGFSFPPLNTQKIHQDCSKQPSREMFNKCMAGE